MLLTVIILITFLSATPAAMADDIQIVDNGLTAGYATLAWPDATGKSFELEQHTAKGWVPLYQGRDRATTLSGLTSGTYSYRLRAHNADGSTQVSSPITLTVSHHPLGRAWTFFGAGAVMFFALIALIATGIRHPIPLSSPKPTEQ